ncbi:hypothetical protein [Peptostreptococcus sp. D1]|uniref:hypothetical protein n=1 Tax=Peptostreptococcus sp. D1 TaxID=72304 RepID=UPI0008E758BD|nr:hypothetical protein [Peptostreptococcus sp. D1]SFE84442.1 hypothetical protein SAMN02910278_01858 [Peptostreptococcus sp. D1]
MDKNKLNASGCKDITAYEAIRKVDSDARSEERLQKLLTAIFCICELAGFHVEGRIALKDKRTGKIWR